VKTNETEREELRTADPFTIPASWTWTEAGTVARIVGGGTPRTSDKANFDGGDVPWITPADLSGYRSKLISRGARNITAKGLGSSGAVVLPAGTVLFSSRAPIGYVAVAGQPVSTNQGFKSFVPAEGVDSDFLYYYLQRAKEFAVALASGTTFLEISSAKTALIPIPLPPTLEQHRIVEEVEKQFTRLDAAAAALKQVRMNLKCYRASVLKAACEGRLVPTEAELARREGHAFESGEELLKRIRRERRTRWEADQLAKMKMAGRPPLNDRWMGRYAEAAPPETERRNALPSGWRWASLGQLIWSVKDGPHYSPTYVDRGIPFITGGNVRPTGVDFASAKRISPELHQELCRRCKPEPGDVLYTKGGTTGIARVNTYAHEFSVWVHVAVLKPVQSIDAFYLQHSLNSPGCVAEAKRFTHGVGNQDLGLTRMVHIGVPVCPLAEQHRIVAEVERRLSVVDELEATVEKNLARCARLRQSILKLAFEGRLVPQDPNDEPASVLLDRIRKERETVAAAGPPRRRQKAARA
jgi:type I restriction enzyme S subunit